MCVCVIFEGLKDACAYMAKLDLGKHLKMYINVLKLLMSGKGFSSALVNYTSITPYYKFHVYLDPH